VENRLESDTKSSNFLRVIFFDAVVDHAYASPILVIELRIVIGVQRRTLYSRNSRTEVGCNCSW